jgi:homeobox protein cut-like
LLTLIKSIEFATGDDDVEIDVAGADARVVTESTGKKETLEQLLLSRNKKLSNELTLLRVSHQDLQSRLEAVQSELSTTSNELQKSRKLTVTLESDLEKVQQEAANNFPSSAMSVAGTYTSRYPHSSYKSTRAGGGRSSSPTSSIISGFDPSNGPGTLESLRASEHIGGGSGILPMITAQRDRFKKKNTELEAELQKSYQTITTLRSEIASLQKDNLNLYEKNRYVSTYNRSTASSAFASATDNPSTIQIDEPDTPASASRPVFDRYRSAYEANLSPFAAFRGRETARAFKRMSLPERAVFQFTKMVLATRTSRNLFAGYCLGLHLLVIIMLFSMGSSGGERVVKAAGPMLAQQVAMAGAGGGADAAADLNDLP